MTGTVPTDLLSLTDIFGDGVRKSWGGWQWSCSGRSKRWKRGLGLLWPPVTCPRKHLADLVILVVFCFFPVLIAWPLRALKNGICLFPCICAARCNSC